MQLSPESFFLSVRCPLTHKLFEEPISLPDGITYEKSAIVEHIKARGKGKKRIHARCPFDVSVTIGELRACPLNHRAIALRNLFIDQNPAHPAVEEWRVCRGLQCMTQGRIAEAASYGNADAIEQIRLEQMAIVAATLVADAKNLLISDPENKEYRVKLRAAAELGSNEARIMMGIAYANGHAGKISHAKSVEWFMKMDAVAELA